MRDKSRIPIVLKCLEENWNKVSDWRLGQLLCNLQRYANSDLFYTEDDNFIELMNEFFKNCK